MWGSLDQHWGYISWLSKPSETVSLSEKKSKEIVFCFENCSDLLWEKVEERCKTFMVCLPLYHYFTFFQHHRLLFLKLSRKFKPFKCKKFWTWMLKLFSTSFSYNHSLQKNYFTNSNIILQLYLATLEALWALAGSIIAKVELESSNLVCMAISIRSVHVFTEQF